MMVIEEHFNVSLPDRQISSLFPSTEPWTIRMLAEAVSAAWGSGTADAGRWKRPEFAPRTGRAVPFTQYVGDPTRGADAGALYRKLGRNAEGFEEFRRGTDGMRCVLVPGGEATLGTDDPSAPADCRPARRVRMNGFLMDAEPVSNAAFARFLNAVGPLPAAVIEEWCGGNPDEPQRRPFSLARTGVFGGGAWGAVAGAERKPAVLVSWFGANAYSLWANRYDWRRFRGDGAIAAETAKLRCDLPASPAAALYSGLPSEAEWEYVARGGDARTFPWGESAPDADRVRAACHAAGIRYGPADLPSADVNERLGMSAFGVHHIVGNVWQWCRDWYHEGFPRTPDAARYDPQNARPTGIRCERGGSWVGPSSLLPCFRRRGRAPALRGRCLGFRCVGRADHLSNPAKPDTP